LGSVGNAGNIDLNTKLLSIKNSKLTTSANLGNGGDINIATDNIIITPDSTINAAAESQQFVSGTINITNTSDITPDLVKLKESYIDVTAQFKDQCGYQKPDKSNLFARNHFNTVSIINLNPSEYTGAYATGLKHKKFVEFNSYLIQDSYNNFAFVTASKCKM
jgi:hypothetical protein